MLLIKADVFKHSGMYWMNSDFFKHSEMCFMNSDFFKYQNDTTMEFFLIIFSSFY
jgi:hypothetical protein